MSNPMGFIPLPGGDVKLINSLDEVEKVPGAIAFNLLDREARAGDVIMWMYSRDGWLAQILVPSLRTEWVKTQEEQCL